MTAPAPAVETLYCHFGEHEFTRRRVRGVKPTVCAEHRTAALNAAARDRTAAKRRFQRAPAPPKLTPPVLPDKRAPGQRPGQRFLDRTEPRQRSDAAKTAHPLDSLYLAVAESSLAVNLGGGDIAKALRKVAAVAELLSLDPRVTQAAPRSAA